MKRLLWISICWILGMNLGMAVSPKTIMLVLGSADPTVLKERIEIAVRLYRTQTIDKIIVSGGCGAHGSGICEATAMQEGLAARGVELRKIYKEENAKTTVQNYVFSRVLRDEQDQRIIQPGDTVFVVSNHWHAISVAARLQQHDGVIARFYIEGSLVPKETDKLDYVGIFNGQPDNEKFVLRGSWCTPEAVWSVKDTTYFLNNNLVYGTDEGNTSISLRKATEVLPLINQLDATHSRAFIDGGKYWWIRNGNRLFKVEKITKRMMEEQAWEGWIKNMPRSWVEGAFSTGVLWNNTLLLFANEKVLVAKGEKKGFVFVAEMPASQYFGNWPFAWGKSNVAAATVDDQTGQLRLFRNMETVRVTNDLQLIGKPEPFRPKWIEDLK